MTVCVTSGRVFAGAGGKLFCVDPVTGQVLWRNKLRGFGVGVVAFADRSSELVQQEAAASRAAAEG